MANCYKCGKSEVAMRCVCGECLTREPAGTNFERIKNMNQEELAELLEGFISNLENEAVLWFDKEYCKNCPTTKVNLHWLTTPREDDFHECDFDGGCLHDNSDKNIISLWLQSKVSDPMGRVD